MILVHINLKCFLETILISDSPMTKTRSKTAAEKRSMDIIHSSNQLKRAKTISDSKITAFYHCRYWLVVQYFVFVIKSAII